MRFQLSANFDHLGIRQRAQPEAVRQSFWTDQLHRQETHRRAVVLRHLVHAVDRRDMRMVE